MPQVAAAGAGIYAGLSALLSTTIIGSVTVGSLLTTVALSGASYAIQRAAAKRAQRGITSELAKQVVKQALPTARVIYGTALVAGSLFFVERPEGSDWLYYGITIANHEINRISEIRMGDRVVGIDPVNFEATTVPYTSGNTTYLYCSIRNGTDDQLIDPILAADFPELPSTFRQRGRATVVLKMYQPLTISSNLNRTLYGNSGQPAPLFLVEGKKIYDPRDASQSASDKSTWKWSESPSLCAADFQTSKRIHGGGGTAWSEIDMQALARAANDDDYIVLKKSGATEKRYTCNGVIELDGTAPSEVVQRILTANMGYRVTSNGKFLFISGVERGAVATLTDSTARGSMNVVVQPSLSEIINIVKTTFVSIDREYQLVEGPELRKAAYITADGAEMPISLELPFTTSHTTAQRLANILLEDSRTGKRIVRTEDLTSILLDAADIVDVKSDVVTASSDRYIIEQIGTADLPIEFNITLRGYNPDAYLWSPATQEQDFTIEPPEFA